MRQKTFKYKFMGDTWKFILQKDSVFEKMHSDKPGSAALTSFSQKTIWFMASQFCEEFVVHEIVHARFGYHCLGDAELNNDQMEEIFAKYMAEYGKNHLKLAEKIFKTMNRFVKKMIT